MRKVILFFLITFWISACSPGTQPGQPDRLRVVATTTIIADVVANVGGENIALTVLLPPGTDPHAFDPAPRDARAVAEADILFLNGVGLEVFLEELFENAGGQAEQVDLSEGLPLRELGVEGQPGSDPHTWMDPANVQVWAQTIAAALSRVDPAHADRYTENAGAYVQQLQELDSWARDQLAQIPPENRKLVTDHDSLGYFAGRYGLEIVGAVIPAYSTLAEPSAQELAALEETVSALGVSAIFVGTTVNPVLASRVARDTGTRLVPLYTGSLSAASGPAATYLDYMRFNVNAIVDALGSP